MIHESPSNVIPWFSFFLFPFFPLAYARRQKLLLELCFSLPSRLDSCEVSSNILSCTFYLFDDLIQDDAHGTSKDTPSHLLLVFYVLCFFFCFFPFHSFYATLLHEQRILIYLANNTIELELSFRTDRVSCLCVCKYGW